MESNANRNEEGLPMHSKPSCYCRANPLRAGKAGCQVSCAAHTISNVLQGIVKQAVLGRQGLHHAIAQGAPCMRHPSDR